jgi:RNA recognition motif-containing protein
MPARPNPFGAAAAGPELELETLVPTTPAATAEPAAAATLDRVDDAPPEPEHPHYSRDELLQMAPSALHRLAVEDGIAEVDIEAAVDSDDADNALIELILRHDARAELQKLKLSELHKRAWAVAPETDVTAAWDSADRKVALVDLILKQPAGASAAAMEDTQGLAYSPYMTPRPARSESSFSSPAPVAERPHSVDSATWNAATSAFHGAMARAQARGVNKTEGSEEEEDPEPFSEPDPFFRMEECTFHVRGIPADPNCDQDWLREVFGEYGEFVQGTIYRRRDAENFALVSFRNDKDVTKLLDMCDDTEIQPARNIARKIDGESPAKDATMKQNAQLRWRVRLRAFQTSDTETKRADAWMAKPHDAATEARLSLAAFDAEVGVAGRSGMAETWEAACSMARTVMQDLHMFLAIERGHDLPAMDHGRSSDAFCMAHFTEKPSQPNHKNGRRSIRSFGPKPKRASCCAQLGKGKREKAPALMHSKSVLGQTRIEATHWDNPSWLWTMKTTHRVSGIGKRGWLIIQVLDEDLLVGSAPLHPVIQRLDSSVRF